MLDTLDKSFLRRAGLWLPSLNFGRGIGCCCAPPRLTSTRTSTSSVPPSSTSTSTSTSTSSVSYPPAVDCPYCGAPNAPGAVLLILSGIVDYTAIYKPSLIAYCGYGINGWPPAQCSQLNGGWVIPFHSISGVPPQCRYEVSYSCATTPACQVKVMRVVMSASQIRVLLTVSECPGGGGPIGFETLVNVPSGWTCASTDPISSAVNPGNVTTINTNSFCDMRTFQWTVIPLWN